jgi:hypothetical protein
MSGIILVVDLEDEQPVLSLNRGETDAGAIRVRRPGGRNLIAGLSRPQEHPAYSTLYRTRADKVQGLLARLTAGVQGWT